MIIEDDEEIKRPDFFIYDPWEIDDMLDDILQKDSANLIKKLIKTKQIEKTTIKQIEKTINKQILDTKNIGQETLELIIRLKIVLETWINSCTPGRPGPIVPFISLLNVGASVVKDANNYLKGKYHDND